MKLAKLPILALRLITAFSAVALTAAFPAAHAAVQSSDTLNALLASRRCFVASYLRAVYESPTVFKDRERFIVVAVTAYAQSYVQCLFGNNRKTLYCEASSGYYAERANKARTTYMPPQAIAALARLGFRTGPHEKNFPYERNLSGVPDFDSIATLMLTALHDGYGARANTALNLSAPLKSAIAVNCGK